MADSLRDTKMEMQKASKVLRNDAMRRNDYNHLGEENIGTVQTLHNQSTANESFDNEQLVQHIQTVNRPHTERSAGETFINEAIHQGEHVIIIPPSSSIPILGGNIVESAYQFLVAVKEYAETINHWSDQRLLRDILQFLQGTVLE